MSHSRNKYNTPLDFLSLSHPLHSLLWSGGILFLSSSVLPGAALAAESGSQYGAEIRLNDGDTLIADQAEAGGLYGIYNPSLYPGTVDLGKGARITVSDHENYARGVMVRGSDSVLQADNVTINVTGDNATGLELTGRNDVADLGTGSRIVVEGSETARVVTGVLLSSASSLKAENFNLSVNGNHSTGLNISDYGSSVDLGSGSVITTNGANSQGIYIDGLNGAAAKGNARFNTTGLIMNTRGANAYGMNIQRNSDVNLGSNSAISVSGSRSTGIWNFGHLMAESLTVNVVGSDAVALEVRGEGIADIGANSHFSSTEGGAVVASGPAAKINLSGTESQRNSVIAGGTYGVSAQTAGASVFMENTDIHIDHKGALGAGLWSYGGATLTGNNIGIHGATGTIGSYATYDSQIDLTGDLNIIMASSAQPALATQHSEGFAASRINGTGKMLINGGIVSSGGMINMDMTSGSVWSGSAFSDNINGGYLNVRLTESDWNVASDSTLDRLSLLHSTVDFTKPLSEKGYTTLTTKNLEGKGSFVMRVDPVGEGNGVNNRGDKVIVTGTSSGEHLLNFINRGSLATTGNEVLTVVETADGVATFSAASQLELGGYQYDVRKNGTNWELYSAKNKPVTPDEEVIPDPEGESEQVVKPVDNDKPGITTTADAGGHFLNISYLLNYAEIQTLMQRMGDLRQSGKEGNAWLRGTGGKFNGFATGKLHEFGLNYSGYQLGFDKRIVPEAPLYFGGFMGVTHGSPAYHQGKGTLQSHHAGLYSVYMGENGFYIEGIAKFNRLKNQFSVRDSQNNPVNGNNSSSGISGSVEMGQKVSLNKIAKGLYIEPQTQLTISHQNGANVKASNGLNIDINSYNSLTGRASALLGYELAVDNSQMNFYLKAGIVREFEGKTLYRLNGSPEPHSFKGNMWNNGLGMSAQFNKEHTLYLEADYASGHQFSQRQITGGYRYSF